MLLMMARPWRRPLRTILLKVSCINGSKVSLLFVLWTFFGRRVAPRTCCYIKIDMDGYGSINMPERRSLFCCSSDPWQKHALRLLCLRLHLAVDQSAVREDTGGEERGRKRYPTARHSDWLVVPSTVGNIYATTASSRNRYIAS